MSVMDPEINLKLHNHIWDVLNDLAIDETLTEEEAESVNEAMGDLAEMLIDSLGLEILDTEEVDGQTVLTVKLAI